MPRISNAWATLQDFADPRPPYRTLYREAWKRHLSSTGKAALFVGVFMRPSGPEPVGLPQEPARPPCIPAGVPARPAGHPARTPIHPSAFPRGRDRIHSDPGHGGLRGAGFDSFQPSPETSLVHLAG